MHLLQIILATIITLGILVTVHEYGHYWVARRCGVKVIRFSIGFGKPLFAWHDRNGTEFVIAAIPLGGYVKMLDEREAPVAPELLSQAFNRKPVGQRIAIVVAGPAANFLFAIVAYWIIFAMGTTSVVPVVGVLEPGSPAAKAGIQSGHEIIYVDGEETRSWDAVSLKLLTRIGDTGELRFITRPMDGYSEHHVSIPIEDWEKGVEQPRPLPSLGIKPYMPTVPPLIEKVTPGGAGEKAGLESGDVIMAVNGEPIAHWQQLVDWVKRSPDLPLDLTVRRGNDELTVIAIPDLTSTPDNMSVGHLGVASKQTNWPEHLLRETRYPIYQAAWPAMVKTWEMSALTLNALKKMVTGSISIKNLSGPITIATVASDSVEKGIRTFLNFLAYLSISLGLINILPIPVLDGGHLMYYLVELVRGRPVSEKTQDFGLRVGLCIIFALMIVAIYNDLMRL
jgi:regulator of sigma E protease